MSNNFPKKAVILAGGKGTRLYPITKEIPKPLLPVGKKPIINYLVDLFQNQGIKEIAVLISRDFKEDFQWWKKRYFSKNNIKLVEESEPLGTFGGLFLLKDWLGDKPFFLTNGDELKEIDLVKMADFHQKTGLPATIALVKVPDPQHYGVVVCDQGKVENFVEKPENPPSSYINSGLYLLDSEVLERLSSPEFLMTEVDLFPKLAQEKKLAGFQFQGKWTDCGTWERYSKALKNWK